MRRMGARLQMVKQTHCSTASNRSWKHQMGGGKSGRMRQLDHDTNGPMGCACGSAGICTFTATPNPTAQQ
jgi:hypothetical protein